MSDSERLSVVMLPDYTRRNPYQERLIRALDEQGVAVDLIDAGIMCPILRSWYHNSRPDVIHLHWVTAFIGTDRWLLAALLGLRTLFELLIVRVLGTDVVWTVHNLRAHESHTPRVDLLTRMGWARLSTHLIVHCESAIDAVCQTYRLSDAYVDRISVIPHGHFIDSYPTVTSADAARDTLGIHPNDRVLLYFGLIRPYKNVPRLIHTFRRLDPDPSSKLLIVGNPWNDDLQQQVSDAAGDDTRVMTRLEFIPDEDVARYLLASDAMVLPFDSILTSGSAILAMSYGRALVIPDVGCPAELISDRGGITYDHDRETGLENALIRALDETTPLGMMGEENRRLATQMDWNDIAASTREVYDREHVHSSDTSSPTEEIDRDVTTDSSGDLTT